VAATLKKIMPNVNRKIFNYYSSKDRIASKLGGSAAWDVPPEFAGKYEDNDLKGGHGDFHTKDNASEHYAPVTACGKKCCDENNPKFMQGLDKINKDFTVVQITPGKPKP
jgi:hypothetical protein